MGRSHAYGALGPRSPGRGPCPPTGDNAHRYKLTWHALKVEKLDLHRDGFIVNADSLGNSTLTGLYGRKQ
jgi:phosphatidylethanolamine-binding protein (PEBP) family uncharacterized protein